MTTPNSASGRARVFVAVALTALCLFHWARLVSFFGGSDALLSDTPLIYNDHGWHYYYCVIGSRFFATTGTTSGYDPFLMAGYVTDLTDASDRLLKVLMALIPLSDPVGYKVVVFFTGAVFPLVFFFAARLLGRDRTESLLASACGLWVWWSETGTVLFETGMTGFLLASAYAFLVLGLLVKFLERPAIVRGVALTAGLGLALILHPGIVPILAFPVAVVLFLRRRQLTVRTVAGLSAAGGVALALNLFWILPAAINLRFATSPATHLQWPLIFIGVIIDSIRHGQLSVIWIPVGAVLGLRQWRREGSEELWLTFSVTMSALALMALVGPMLPLVRELQPVRFFIPLIFAACLPAAAWLWGIYRRARALRGRERRRSVMTLTAVAVSAAIVFFLPVRDPNAMPFVGVGPDVVLVRDWIIRSTDRSARVMVEDNGPIVQVFEKSLPLSYVAFATDRELIGGPGWADSILPHYADLSGIRVLGREFRDWDGRQLADEVARFNVGWVIARTKYAVELFNRFPDVFIPLEQIEGFHFYRFARPGGFFIAGKGQVHAERNLLRVEEAHTHLGRVIRSYHWHPYLTVDPPRRIFRAMIGDDPVGFVGVEGEGGSYDIRLRYPIFHRPGD